MLEENMKRFSQHHPHQNCNLAGFGVNKSGPCRMFTGQEQNTGSARQREILPASYDKKAKELITTEA